MRKRSAALSLFVIIFTLFSGWLYLNRQYVKDYAVVRTTDVSTPASAIADELKLTDRGTFLYDASQTELQDAQTFNQSCSGIEKQAVILGCYNAQRIYIYNIKDKKLTGVREVTAAHELLHAAYERLSPRDRATVDELLQAQLKKTTDKDVLETIRLYKGADQSTLLNEIHSIFGTELGSLSPELENYYKRYFTQRSLVVAYAKKYRSVFKKLEAAAATQRAQLAEKQQTKEAYEVQLKSLTSQIQAQQQTMTQLRNTDVQAYNALVPGYNQLVNNYNSQVQVYRTLIDEMNALITALNSNITQLNNLTKKLDSHYKAY